MEVEGAVLCLLVFLVNLAVMPPYRQRYLTHGPSTLGSNWATLVPELSVSNLIDAVRGA